MTNIYQYRAEGPEEDYWVSDPFYTRSGGYRLCLSAAIGQKSRLFVYVILMKGKFDSELKWPFNARIKIQLLNYKPKGRPLEREITYKNGGRVTGGYSTGHDIEGMGLKKPIKLYTYSSSFVRNNTLQFRISSIDF